MAILCEVQVLDCPDRDSLRAYYEDARRECADAEGTVEAVEHVCQCRKLLADHCQIHGCDPDWLKHSRSE